MFDSKTSFQLEPFRPSRLWLNPHAQTVIANSIRPTKGVEFKRQRLDTPDGDFVDLDFALVPEAPVDDDSSLILVLHGLEGSARSGYAFETYRQLAARGVRSVGLNFRSCSGEMNLTPRLYHSGATEDVAWIVEWLAEKFPRATLGAVGFSLGASVLLKHLGEIGAHTHLRAAVAVSPPFDLARSAGVFQGGSGKFYGRRFLKDLREKAQAHAAVAGEHFDLASVLEARTVREFDDAFTAPLHGFRDAQDYYDQSSCGQYVPGIKIPTLILRALDDPFFASDVPHQAIADNDCIAAGLPAHGGHVGFMEGSWPGNFSFWAERQAARFLAMLNES